MIIDTLLFYKNLVFTMRSNPEGKDVQRLLMTMLSFLFHIPIS